MNETVYRIKDRETGKFSTGGAWPKFTKQGKIWKNKTVLLAHLKMLKDGYRRYYDPTRYEVVEYELKEFGYPDFALDFVALACEKDNVNHSKINGCKKV